MYWILIIQITLALCSGDRCQLSQPASAPFTSLEDCDRAKAYIASWGGDGTTVTLVDDAGAATTLTLTWACVPAHLSLVPKD